MYTLIRSLVLWALRAPGEPPDPPIGSPSSVVVFRASKKLLTLRLFQLVIPAFTMVLTLGGLAVAAVASRQPFVLAVAGTLVAIPFVLVLVWQYVLIRLDWDMRYYIVTDRSIRIREGALRIHEHTHTFANIQNLSIEQGPLERLLGIANVRIQTAGGGMQVGQPGQAAGHGGTLQGIEDAEAVRDRILALLRAYRDAGLGDERARPKAPPSAMGGPGFSPEAMHRLREVRDEAVALRRAVEQRTRFAPRPG
ncbi:MAG: PH domain-containing protein [Sandaracinaceae bacterium]